MWHGHFEGWYMVGLIRIELMGLYSSVFRLITEAPAGGQKLQPSLGESAPFKARKDEAVACDRVLTCIRASVGVYLHTHCGELSAYGFMVANYGLKCGQRHHRGTNRNWKATSFLQYNHLPCG